jgi:hypothetical protein
MFPFVLLSPSFSLALALSLSLDLQHHHLPPSAAVDNFRMHVAAALSAARIRLASDYAFIEAAFAKRQTEIEREKELRVSPFTRACFMCVWWVSIRTHKAMVSPYYV